MGIKLGIADVVQPQSIYDLTRSFYANFFNIIELLAFITAGGLLSLLNPTHRQAWMNGFSL
jgi:hypothetical protein